MKNRLFTILYWLLSHLDEGRLKSLKIDVKTEIELEKYIPEAGKWYQVECSLTHWIKREGVKKGKFDHVSDVTVYVNGKLEARYPLARSLEKEQ